MTLPESKSRREHRDARLVQLGLRPPWWRPFARRRWAASRRGIMAMDVSVIAEFYAQHYSRDYVEQLRQRRPPALSMMRREDAAKVSFCELVTPNKETP